MRNPPSWVGDEGRARRPGRSSHTVRFVSFDLCCRGRNSTYNIRVGRARRITGPYLDQEGRPMLLGGGTPLMQGTAAWAGPGGQFVLRDSKTDLLAFHADDGTTGRPTLEISTLSWEDGWPRVGMLPGERPQGAIASSRFD